MESVRNLLRQEATVYPAFFEAHVRRGIEAYHTQKQQTEEGIGFFFITDIHIHLNGRASVPLILKIGNETGVDTVLCGGDHCWAFGSKAQCLKDFDDSLRYMDPIRDSMKLYHARGNHDCTIKSSFGLNTGYTLPYTVLQQTFQDHSTPADGAVEGKLYYYADDAKAMVRYIILDTSEPQLSEDTAWGVQETMEKEQLSWLAQTALQLPGEEWTAIVMGHIPCCPEIPGYAAGLNDLRLILEAFQHKTACAYGDFQSAQGELAAYLCGHNHKDASVFFNGVLHISTGCDAYCKDDIWPRDVGCIQNTLFDLFLLDKKNKTLRTFRIGAGEDRVFSYR